ncbi:MAG TPA: condensation domain-containing protein, partial [Myxococcaceae bacterium]|nr:condensation domain-containing protein [Myxococcaceae bacterium]
VLRLALCSRLVQLSSEDRIAQVSNIAFDAATFELWASLLRGARLVILPREVTLSPKQLAHALREEGITVQFLTTALFNQVARELPDAFSSLRSLLFGGEAAEPSAVRRVLESKPPLRLVNAYGPTETTTFATSYGITHVPEGASAVPIGQPISNTSAYVLDEHLRPVPVGVPGELYVGGEGVARGYLGRPELTAERFLPDPFSTTPGARLYRTGDKVRWLACGALEYVGRIDFQVKLRGFRIELGEVESALRELPGLHEAVVLAREDVPGDKRLVAYVVPDKGQSPDSGQLRAALLAKLPEHMVPSAFVVLEALPLTPNGKVDRKALPAPDGSALALQPSRPPETETEKKLAAIWAEVLRVEQVGAEDDFFALGGHSLLATQVLSRVRATFGVELPLRALFEAPTVAGLASRFPAAVRTQAPPLVPVSREGHLPLSFAQQRLWFLDQLEPGRPFYNVPLAFRVSGRLDVAALERGFHALVERHESLRTIFVTRDEEPQQLISPAVEMPLSVVDLSEVPQPEREVEAKRLAEEEARRPFSLERGPLLRTLLLRLGEDEHVLLITLHHIISDGWSLGVLVREVAALYHAFASGQRPRLEPLPVQYADYAAWQRQWLRGEALEVQLAYWRQRLEGAPAALELPTDRPRPPVQTYRGDNVPVRLPRELSESLQRLCQQEGVTPFMVLLAAWQALLSRYSGQEDVCVGSPIAGRTQAETEGLIGFFVNTLVLRAQVQPGASFRELLAQVRDTTLGAYEHQH